MAQTGNDSKHSVFVTSPEFASCSNGEPTLSLVALESGDHVPARLTDESFYVENLTSLSSRLVDEKNSTVVHYLCESTMQAISDIKCNRLDFTRQGLGEQG